MHLSFKLKLLISYCGAPIGVQYDHFCILSQNTEVVQWHSQKALELLRVLQKFQ